jgi:cysteine desulfurase
MKPIYLDYNGTTPHDLEVIRAMRPFLEEEFGNPSSSHWYGIAPKRAVSEARRQVSALLGCFPEEIIFTSGGTESNNHAVRGAAMSLRSRGNHIITSRIEHPAVLEVCAQLEEEGFEVTYLPVDDYGEVSTESLRTAVRPETILITIMHSNNEVGTVQPIDEIAGIARSNNILTHTDAAQSVGKVWLDVEKMGVDMLSVAGHKVYGPKGVGALYVRKGVEIKRFMFGAGQEGGRRAGTENLLEIVGLGKACEVAKRDFVANTERMRNARDLLRRNLSKQLDEIKINGHPEKGLPNTLSVSFKGLDSSLLLEEIGLDVAVSAGAACHSDTVTISHVLQAMRIPDDWAGGTLRFSTGKFTTDAEVERASDVIIEAVGKLRGVS